jgi:maltose O-acetyltransferase
MTSQKARMLAGQLYDSGDPQLKAERLRARSLCHELNALPIDALADKARILESLFGRPVTARVTPPFFCDYGYNIELGTGVFFNYNCVVLDVSRIAIGDNTLFGPAVQIYGASHPMTVAERRTGLEYGRPVTIGADAWIGGGAIICPGVTIGDSVVIGAGSVVTRDIAPGMFAAGNPCRAIRRLD